MSMASAKGRNINNTNVIEVNVKGANVKLKKGKSVSDSTRLDVPSYDLDSLKKGEVVGEGTELDLPSYETEEE